jgi:polyisoprenyl-teichoic acid--peptidoglycan teichoic acid transferase
MRLRRKPDQTDASAGRHRAAHARRKSRRTWGQRFILTGGLLGTLALTCSAAGMTYLYRKLEKIPRVELSRVLEDAPKASGPENYLVVGVDSAERTALDDPIRVGRADEHLTDTIMIVRIDPDTQEASILSIPRDLYVDYGDGGKGKINAAFVRGGMTPDLLIGIINNYLGIPIHHYIQVDLAGFLELVDAVDGVPIYFPLPAKDDNSGLSVFQTGCVTLDRDQAVGYVRSRHYEELVQGDGSKASDWQNDNKNDFGRIERQQNFIRSALERAISRGARNPGTMNRLIDVGLRSVVIDDELSAGALLDLGKAFRRFDPNSINNVTLPVQGSTGPGGASIQLLVESKAEEVLARFRDPVASTPDGSSDAAEGEVTPSMVRITVLNGSEVRGQAAAAGDALTGVGFTVLGVSDAQGEDRGLGVTVVRYPEGSRAQAELVARWLGAEAELREVPAAEANAAAGIEVITAADWSGVLAEPRPAPPPTTTTTTTAPRGAGNQPATTTTTVPSSTPSTVPQPEC